MRQRQFDRARRIDAVEASDRVARFLHAVVEEGGDGIATEFATVVRASGLSWAGAASIAGRLRRSGCLARLPHGRLMLSELGRAAISDA